MMMNEMNMNEMNNFNASITVTELLTKTLENVSRDLASRCIMECASKYGFSGEEAIRALGLERVTLNKKKMQKSEKSEKVLKVKKEKKEKKSKIPLPFETANVSDKCCQGLTFNHGLFTQCKKGKMESSTFCNGCQKEADTNSNGMPNCGTVSARLACGLYEFKDSKGRSPTNYLKVLAKLKVSTEEAMAEASKLGIELANEHFEAPIKKVSEKNRGRPKKAASTVQATNVDDLFAKLTSDEVIEEVKEIEEPVVKKKALSDEEKAAKKAALEQEREQKKLEREQKKAEEKALKEAQRKAEAEQKKLERESKLAQEKAEREQKRAAEKEAKEAAKKEAKEAAKKSDKKEDKKEAKKSTKKEAKTEAKVEAKVEEEKPAKVQVSRIQIDGKMYLKSSTNILYDPATKEEVGLYDPISKSIKPLPEEDDEEEAESEYEEDDDEE